jgi:AraC-like DNA-binding protein
LADFYKFTKPFFYSAKLEIKFFKPQNKILQQYLEGYYFMSKNENEPDIEYLTFPNNFSIISVYENTEVTFMENKVIIEGMPNNHFFSDLICHYKKPIRVHCKGKLNEITFYFKPLGLNAFLKKPLCRYTNDFFSNFVPFEDYATTMRDVLKQENRLRQCEMIEDYWFSKIIGFEHPFLKGVMDDLLTKTAEDFSIADLAGKYKTSRQNLNKHFELHLCKSPSTFKKIHRFREAMKAKMNKKPNENLTSLGYDLLFYDQSHLIRDFKALTGLTPKTFFKNISLQEDGEVNWLFIH